MAIVGLILAIAFFVFFSIVIPLFFGMPGLSFGGRGGYPATPPMIKSARETSWKYAVIRVVLQQIFLMLVSTHQMVM
jgi:hypothetical protein